MSELRAQAYRGEHGLVVLLSSICAALLIVTAFGIIGLTSYGWRNAGNKSAFGGRWRHPPGHRALFSNRELLDCRCRRGGRRCLAITLNL